MSTNAATLAGEDGYVAFETAVISFARCVGLVGYAIWAFGEPIRVEIPPTVPANQLVQIYVSVLLHPHYVWSTLLENQESSTEDERKDSPTRRSASSHWQLEVEVQS